MPITLDSSPRVTALPSQSGPSAAPARPPRPDSPGQSADPVDAAAKRVAGAYASGGDAAAAAQLRTELESVKTPAERAATLKAAMPVVDQVAHDLGLNAGRGAGDWNKDGHEKDGSYSADTHNANPIDSRIEYDGTVKDLMASVELAQNQGASAHIAEQLLQLLPAQTSNGSGPNGDKFLGLLGDNLAAGSVYKPQPLASAVALVLVQPGEHGRAGTVLALDLPQRDAAAKRLDPGLRPGIVIDDWTDSGGIRHDGTVWHELSQNPDLFLTQAQHHAIEARTHGWNPGEINAEKTAQALRNLRAQNPGNDLDGVNAGDSITYQDPDAQPRPTLDADVQTAVDKSKAGHGGDGRYAQTLDFFVGGANFRKLGKEQQLTALGGYDRTLTQSAHSDKPLAADQTAKLETLLTSAGFHSVNDRVKDRLLGLFTEDANRAADKLDTLQALVDSDGFKTVDNEQDEFRILEAYQHDSAFEGRVNDLLGHKALSRDALFQALNPGASPATSAPPSTPPGGSAATPPSTASGTPAAGPVTPQTITTDLNTAISAARQTATSGATINDPLRRIAGEDPVTYAYLKLTHEHANDKPYLDALKIAIVDYRRDDTTRRVRDLAAQGKTGDALTVLKTGMDAAADPAERAKLFEAAGKPVFTRAYFDKQVDKITADLQDLDAESSLGSLFNEVGENAPPEVANLLLDALKSHLENGEDDHVVQVLMRDASLDAYAYPGLSMLVDRAGDLGNDRSQEFAGLLYKHIDVACRNIYTRWSMFGNQVGLAGGVKHAVGDHGAARLSVALLNQMQGKGPDDWQTTARFYLRDGLRAGIDELHHQTGGAVTAWQTDNKTALRFVQDFGAVGPEQVARAIVDDRKANPGDADTVDASRLKVEQQGVKIDRALRDLVGIGIDFDHTSDPGEKSLGKAIKALDDDPVVLSTLQSNISLQQNLATKINFGQFDGNDSPFNPAAITGAQGDYIDKLVHDYHLPDTVAAGLRARTDAWEKALRAEAAKGDKASDAQLSALTDGYQKDIEKILEGKVPTDGSALVQPAGDMVTQIRTRLQSLGTTTSTLRLTKNFYTVTGEAVLNTYVQVAFKRGLADPAAWSPRSTTVGNAARLLNADKSLVEDTFKYLVEWKVKVQAKVDPKTGLLSAADRNALALEFKQGMPDYGSGVDTSDVNHPAHVSSRLFRLLGAACFIGSSINNAVNASKEPGVTSSDLFALFFGAGGATDLYRGLSGQSFKSEGRMVDWVSKTSFGNYLKNKAGSEAVGDFVKTVKDGGVGGLLTVADMMWAYEDFAGEPIWASDKSASGDTRAGLLTSGVVLGDVIDLGAMALRTQAGRVALTGALEFFGAETAAVSAQAWLPVVGWVGAGLTAGFLAARFAYGVSKAKNAFEYGEQDSKRYVAMVRSLGFTDPQMRQLLNNNGGGSELKVSDWEWFVPVWNGVRAIQSTWKDGKSFFTEGGVSPMHVLNRMFDQYHVPQAQRLQYLQSLSDTDVKKLVAQTHNVLDHQMGGDGSISDDTCANLKTWMSGNGLWKSTYLGK